MKKILVLLCLALGLAACKKSLSSLNTDPKHPSAVPASTLFTGAEKGLADILSTPNVNYNIFRLLAQQWTQTTYTDESKYDLKTRSIPDNFWEAIYSRVHLTTPPSPDLYVNVLSNLNAAKKAIDKDVTISEEVRKNQLAMNDILMVYAWSILVNIYGDIPYTEALNADNPQPKYDDDAAIYTSLLERLEGDIANLNPGEANFGGADLIYGGNLSAWEKFAQSLKLKLGMMLADADPGKASGIVAAAAPHVFTSNADNALFRYEGAVPNTNQIYIELVTLGRKDFVAANTLLDRLKALNDPRMGVYFTDSAEAGAGNYVGGIYGSSNSYSRYSHVGKAIRAQSLPYDFLDYAEVEFLLAEAVERGWYGNGTAASHYDKAIAASFQYWLGDTAGVAAYLARPDVNYATATGNYRQKIGTQKWIALYNRGYDAWTEWRRLDYPVFNPPPGMTQADIPVRFTYPVTEQNLNVDKYNAAAAAIGGDKASTRLFWDKF